MKYSKVFITHILEVEPLKLYAETVKKAGSLIKGDYVNGTFFGMHDKRFVSVGAIVNGGKLICRRLAHDNVKRAHYIVWNDGNVTVEMLKDIDREKDLSKVHFAIAGFNMFPLNLEAEWYNPAEVGRSDWRTCLGYNPITKKAYITVRPYSDAKRGQSTLQNLGCTMGIGLDSGGSTNARFCGKAIRLTDRIIHNILRWKN